jgi:hypothetical protein
MARARRKPKASPKAPRLPMEAVLRTAQGHAHPDRRKESRRKAARGRTYRDDG